MDTQAGSAGITRWDRLIAPYYGAGLVRFGAAEELVKRQELRTGGFEVLLARARDAPDAESRSRACQALLAEYERRLDAWAVWRRNWFKDDDLARWLAGITTTGPGGSAALFWAPVLFAVVCIRRVLGTGSIPQLHRALRHRRCPDCWYDLSRCPPPIGTDAFGARICPHRCPACGGLWPLLPSPAQHR
ncbi:MAG: hypothetical protein IT431_08580 [Phycisphaerales bacterium]|nr:hypothetical protein [Phycisphaerales bacterium]